MAHFRIWFPRLLICRQECSSSNNSCNNNSSSRRPNGQLIQTFILILAVANSMWTASKQRWAISYLWSETKPSIADSKRNIYSDVVGCKLQRRRSLNGEKEEKGVHLKSLKGSDFWRKLKERISAKNRI